MYQNCLYVVRVAKFERQLKFQFHAAFGIGKFIVVGGGGGTSVLGGSMCVQEKETN